MKKVLIVATLALVAVGSAAVVAAERGGDRLASDPQRRGQPIAWGPEIQGAMPAAGCLGSAAGMPLEPFLEVAFGHAVVTVRGSGHLVRTPTAGVGAGKAAEGTAGSSTLRTLDPGGLALGQPRTACATAP